MSFETTALLLTWFAILLLGLVVAGLIRQVHALGGGAGRTGLGPPAGSAAPGIARLAPATDAPTLLLFLTADCPSCATVLAEAGHLRGRSPVAVRAVFAGPPLAGAERTGVPVYPDEAELFAAYGVPATPFGVLVDHSGRIRLAVPVGSAAAVRDLLLSQAGAVPAGPARDGGTPR